MCQRILLPAYSNYEISRESAPVKLARPKLRLATAGRTFGGESACFKAASLLDRAAYERKNSSEIRRWFWHRRHRRDLEEAVTQIELRGPGLVAREVETRQVRALTNVESQTVGRCRSDGVYDSGPVINR